MNHRRSKDGYNHILSFVRPSESDLILVDRFKRKVLATEALLYFRKPWNFFKQRSSGLTKNPREQNKRLEEASYIFKICACEGVTFFRMLAF